MSHVIRPARDAELAPFLGAYEQHLDIGALNALAHYRRIADAEGYKDFGFRLASVWSGSKFQSDLEASWMNLSLESISTVMPR